MERAPELLEGLELLPVEVAVEFADDDDLGGYSEPRALISNSSEVAYT